MTLVSIAMLARLAPDRGTEMHIRAFHVLLGFAVLTLCWMLAYWNFIGVRISLGSNKMISYQRRLVLIVVVKPY